MIKHKASKRYAQALFNVADHDKLLDRVHQDLGMISQAFADSREFALFIFHPEIASQKRIAVFEKLFKKRVCPLTYQFLNYIEKKDRLALLAEICDEFEDLYFAHTRVLKVAITSAHPLDKKQVKALIDRFKLKFQKDIQATETVVPELIGGFKVQVGDQIFDQSLQTQLHQLKEKILNA